MDFVHNIQLHQTEPTNLIEYLVHGEIFPDLIVVYVNLHIQTLSPHSMQNFH